MMKGTRDLTCGNKNRYASKKAAQKAMTSYRRRVLKGLPISAQTYACGDHWHWGHYGKRKR